MPRNYEMSCCDQTIVANHPNIMCSGCRKVHPGKPVPTYAELEAENARLRETLECAKAVMTGGGEREIKAFWAAAMATEKRER